MDSNIFAKNVPEVTSVLNDMQGLKDGISSTLVNEMKRRRMTRKEFAKLIGVSFPTFKKLIINPHSQSIISIENIFKKLSGMPI